MARPQPLPASVQTLSSNVQPPPQHNKPFETINAEKLNPSRVEAMHKMFEGRPNQQVRQQRGGVPLRRGSSSKESDPTYSEIGEFQREEAVSCLKEYLESLCIL
jgi:hypothetical protein